MPDVSLDDVRWAGSYADDNPLREIFCITFVKDLDETDALGRMGAFEDTLRPRTLAEIGAESMSFAAGYPTMACALRLGAWAVVVEPEGFEGADRELLSAMSRGSEAVSVLRHDYATDGFGYAVDGTLVAGFDPGLPGRRWGAEPNALLPRMRALGLDPDAEERVDDAIVRALALAAALTGVVLPPEAMTGTLTSAAVEPWFSAALPSSAYRPADPQLVRAIEDASPRARRAVADGEVRRLAALLDVAGTPGLDDALAAAGSGAEVSVTSDSELGRHVRTWLTDARRASRSLNDASARRISEDDRTRAFLSGWLARALHSALCADSLTAAYGALYPLTNGPARLRDADAHAAALERLHDDGSPASP